MYRPSAPRLLTLIGCLCLLPTLALAQYKIIGPDGKVTYSDVPPAPNQGKAATLQLGGAGNAGVDLAGLPADLRQAVSRYPVVLYATGNCAPCDAGRDLLLRRGVPFTERRVESSADIEALSRLSGDRTLPVLTIGQQKLKAFSAGDWNSYLDAAAYPASSKLPAGYRRPPSTPMVAAPAAPGAAAAGGQTPAAEPRPEPAADEPKIKF